MAARALARPLEGVDRHGHRAALERQRLEGLPDEVGTIEGERAVDGVRTVGVAGAADEADGLFDAAAEVAMPTGNPVT